MSSAASGNAGLARSSIYASFVAVVLGALSVIPFLQNTSPNVVAAYYSTWAVLWLSRRASHDTTVVFDGLVLIATLLSSNLSLIKKLAGAISGYTLSALPAISSASLIVVLLISVLLTSNGNGPGIPVENQDPEKHCRPLLFPCCTTHTRFFPKRHSFAYSYLLVGVPVGPQGTTSLNSSMLSIDTGSSSSRTYRKKGWFHVQGSDYLERGDVSLDLKAKLAQYLRSQGISDDEWHHAYLVTAAKFLGYSFNPVSFWYIYSANHELVVMILEVNNTFDERRMYLLRGSSHDRSGASDGGEGSGQATKFANAWAKDFHVSPFNSRKGSYSLAAINPFFIPREASPRIDNNIVLRSSEGHPKLVARVFSNGPPQDPSTLSTWQLLQFIGAWWWVGFVTFPRIVKEAYKLYFKRGLKVFFRPEVVPTSIGRHYTAIERDLESFFRQYLGYLVSKTDQHVQVLYTPAPGLGKPQEFLSSSGKDDQPVSSLDIRITSPAFYSRFVHYNHTSEALDREALFTDEKNRTAWISNPQALKSLPLNHPRYVEPMNPSLVQMSAALGWHILRKLRCLPAAPSYPDFAQGLDPAFVRVDIRPQGFSTCDEYVMRNCPDAWLYRRCVLKLFLAQRFSLGFTGTVDLLDLIIRVCLIAGVLFTLPTDLLHLPEAVAEHSKGSALPEIIGFNSIHIWSMIKGAI